MLALRYTLNMNIIVILMHARQTVNHGCKKSQLQKVEILKRCVHKSYIISSYPQVGGVLDMKWSGKDSALCAMASGELVTLQINEDRTSIDVNIYSQIRYTAYFFLN